MSGASSGATIRSFIIKVLRYAKTSEDSGAAYIR